MYSIGIDLGGTNIAAGVVEKGGRIAAKADTPTLSSRPFEEVAADMAACARRAMELAEVTQDQIESVGIGIPGVAEARSGKVLFCPNLGWRNVPLRQEMQKYFDLPVYIDNDATVAGWAEYQAGVSRGTNSSVFLTLGTGLGAGIVINGRIWSGAHGAATELGHLTIETEGVPCTCGKRGCAERYCSATAIVRMAREACEENPGCALLRASGGKADRLTAKKVFDAAKGGDATAMQVFARYTKYLTIVINNIISFLDPDMIVLGGGVSAAGNFLLDAIKAQLPQYLMYPTLPTPELRIALLGNDAGIIGAALLKP